MLNEISKCKRAAIIEEVHPNCARNIGKGSIPVVGIENIPLEAAPGAIGTNEIVDGAPSFFVSLGRLLLHRRIGNYLPPEKTVQVLPRSPGHQAVRAVDIGEASMIE